MQYRKTEKEHRSQLGSPTSDFDWAKWQPAGAHSRSFGRSGKVAYICACRYVSLSLRCNLCKCVRLCLPMCHILQTFILQRIWKYHDHSGNPSEGLALRVRKRRAMPNQAPITCFSGMSVFPNRWIFWKITQHVHAIKEIMSCDPVLPTSTTHSLRTIVGACWPDAEVGCYDFFLCDPLSMYMSAELWAIFFRICKDLSGHVSRDVCMSIGLYICMYICTWVLRYMRTCVPG